MNPLLWFGALLFYSPFSSPLLAQSLLLYLRLSFLLNWKSLSLGKFGCRCRCYCLWLSFILFHLLNFDAQQQQQQQLWRLIDGSSSSSTIRESTFYFVWDFLLLDPFHSFFSLARQSRLVTFLFLFSPSFFHQHFFSACQPATIDNHSQSVKLFFSDSVLLLLAHFFSEPGFLGLCNSPS